MAQTQLDQIAEWIIRHGDNLRENGVKRMSFRLDGNMETLAEIELFEKTAERMVPNVVEMHKDTGTTRDDGPDMDSFDGDLDLYHTG